MVDTLLLRTSLHFTQLHFTLLHYTCRNFAPSHINFTQLHFTNNVKKEMKINGCKMSLLSHCQGIVLEKAKHIPLQNLMKFGWISSLYSLRISTERTMVTHLTACVIISRKKKLTELNCNVVNQVTITP